MADHSRSPGFWQSVRQLPGRTPLRTKLIAAVLALVVAALAVISIASVSILKSTLLGPTDSQLVSGGANPGFSLEVGHVLERVQSGGGPLGEQAQALDWISGGRVHQLIVPTEGFYGPTGGPQTYPGPAVPSASWVAANTGHTITLPAQSGDGSWRVYAQHVQFSINGTTYNGIGLQAVDVTSVYKTIGQLVTIDLLISLAVLVLLGLAGVAVIRRSLRPLTDIEQTAGTIAAGDLTRRVPERDPRTEVGRLGRSLNVMLSQIESAFRAQSRSEAAARRSEERMRQFVADASHELRTPLTAIRGFAEYYRQRGGVAGLPEEAANGTPDADVIRPALNETGQLSPADLARIMRRVEQESARMGVLVEDMLLLARLDQQRPLERTTVDLLALAADAVQDARVMAPNRSINLTVGAGAALFVNGDEVRLRQVIGNLMSNALAHTPDGSPVDVHIRSGNLEEIWAATGTAPTTGYSAGAMASQKVAVLEVTDHGPGLTEDQQAHVFERFYRADQARTSEGTGLGLAIVAALVGAHGGAVWVQSDYGHGATFSIALPLAPEALNDEGDPDLPDEDADVLEWGTAPEAEDAAAWPEPPEPPQRWVVREVTDRPEGATSHDAADEPRGGSTSGDFHGASAWQGPASWSNGPPAGGG
jgi:two-component system, OmpR family, sensor kinase